MPEPSAGPICQQRIAELESENLRLQKINQVLMDRVERSLNSQGSEFGVFQTAILLENKVRERTVELEAAMKALEESNRELCRAKEAAEEANCAKGDFLANMSHEIRTPLNGVLGMLDLVLESCVSSGQREYLEVAQRSASALLRVINDILDFSKIEAGKLQLDPILFALRNEAVETVRTFAVLAHEKGLELVCRIDPDVPDGVVGDVVRVRQVLTNLIGNAIKFTEAGEIELRVDRASDAGEGTVLHFAVRDTGIGIAAEKCEVIFAAFTQADPSTTRRYGGTGLGLSISARLVQMMGGRIWLESEPGCGSTFHFTARFDTPCSDREECDDARLLPLRGVPVLVADDNRTSLDILRGALEHWGMAPTAVASGPEACSAVARACAEGDPFRLVILDGQMPGMNGYAVAQQILREWPHDRLSILMLASSPVPAEIHRYRTLGVHTVLMKPVRHCELRDSLLQALRSPGNRSEAA